MARAYLTRRALLDIDAIDRYSTERWGDTVAEQYLADLHEGLRRIEASPALLRKQPGLSLRLRFYPVREHQLICDVIENRIYVLALRHVKMDLPRRLVELEPLLVHEARMLHDRIVALDD